MADDEELREDIYDNRLADELDDEPTITSMSSRLSCATRESCSRNAVVLGGWPGGVLAAA